MRTRDYYCPRCQKDFEGKDDYEGGECPLCGNEYYIYDECTEDYSDCWASVEWEYWQ